MKTSIKKMKLSDLIPAENNPRQIKKDDFERLKKSIKSFPKMLDIREIVVDENNRILGGHQRVKALLANGEKEVNVKVVEGLSEEEKREFVIRDNIQNGEWDFDVLANEWDDLPLDDWGIELPIADIEEEIVEDEAPEPPAKPKSKLGEIYQLGEHRLMCGDSTDAEQVAKLMNGQRADMVFTGPPYNVDYAGGSKKREKIKNDSIDDFYGFLISMYGRCWENMRDGASIYVCHSELERVNFTRAFLDAGFKLSSIIIWAKNNSTFSMNKDYKQKHEPILFGWKGTNHKWNGGNCEDTLWEIKRPAKSELHLTMKPIELCARAIKNSSDRSGLVYEPFGGSGSTLIACEQTGRKCFMMELDPHYVDVIIERWENLTGKKAKLIKEK